MGGSVAAIRKGFNDYEHSRKTIHQSSQLITPADQVADTQVG
jgi:hypothetical protein